MADVKKALFHGHHNHGGGARNDHKGEGRKVKKKSKDRDRDKTPRDPGLGWNRLRLTIQPLSTMSIDTGIGGKNFVEDAPPLGGTLSEGEQPAFTNPTGSGGTSLLVPAPGILPASRVMVIPLAPTSSWASITMPTEPLWSTETQTVWITLANTEEFLPMEINLLVYDPLRHSPGRADTYTTGA